MNHPAKSTHHVRRHWLGLLGAAALLSAQAAGEWPQFLGPDRNGVSTESLAPTLPKDGPKQLWSVKVGSGWSGPVVTGGRVLLHHRVGKEEVLEALDAASGRSIWKSSQPTGYEDDFGFDNGPRGTPCIAGDRVFTFGAEGRLTAMQLSDGKALWTRPLGAELKGAKGFFGFACSPLVVSNRVVVQLGGANGHGVVALRCDDGQLVWKATPDEAGYAAPVLQTSGGPTRVAVFNREGFALLDATTGSVLQQYPWRARMHASVNASTPLAVGDRVFLTTSYDTGAVLLDVSGRTPKVVWSGDESLSAHYASVVPLDGMIFGFHGRAENSPVFRCVELATGRVLWTESGSGGGSVLRAGKTLILLRDSGELELAPATREGFQPTPRVQILGTQTRAVPALSDGVLFARDRSKLVAVRLGRAAE